MDAFGRLCARRDHGWTLHLVGGCKEGERSYLESVRRAAVGLSVEFHVDAGGAELATLLARAGIFWHAAGLGENIDRHPERFEHFGIAVVEAMAAGAVPVVFGAAGPVETVRHGIDGFQFRSLDELVALTEEVMLDGELRARLSAAAVERGSWFSDERFAARLLGLVERLEATPATPR